MKILYGMVRPDAGSDPVKGALYRTILHVTPSAPGIAMIHQHFMLVEAMTVVENVMLGWKKAGAWLQEREVAKLIRSTSQEYGLDLDPTPWSANCHSANVNGSRSSKRSCGEPSSWFSTSRLPI